MIRALLPLVRPSPALLVTAAAVLAGAIAVPVPARGAEASRTVSIKVTDAGFEPRQVKAKAGEPLTLAFTRTSDRTCMTAIDIPDEDVKELQLPLNRTVTVTVTPRKKGVERFHCSAMGMGGGKIVVE